MCGRRSQGRRVGLNESVAGTLSGGARGRVVSSASDRLGNSRQFAFGRVKDFRKSAFFPPLWQSPERLGSVCSVGFSCQIKATPQRTPGGPGRAAGAAPPAQRRARAARGPGGGMPPSPRWVFLSPRAPIPGPGGGGAARDGQPVPPRGGDHPPAAIPRIAMETAAAADQSFPAAQPRVPPPGTRGCRERGAAPRNDPPDGQRVVPSGAASLCPCGRAAARPLSAVPAVRWGRAGGAQRRDAGPAGAGAELVPLPRRCPPLPSPPGNLARPGPRSRIFPAPLSPQRDLQSQQGPLPRDGAAASFSGLRVKLGQFPRSPP